MVKTTSLNFWNKTIIFLRTEFLSLVASSIFLYTWWQEKVTIEDSRAKIAEFLRLESEIGQCGITLKIFELQQASVIDGWKLSLMTSKIEHVALDTGTILKNYFQCILSAIKQQNIIINTTQKQQHPSGDSFYVFDYEKYLKDSELSEIIATNNLETITKYDIKSTQDFEKKISQLDNSSQGMVYKLTGKIKSDFNSYFWGYIMAGLVLTFSKIIKIKSST